MNFGIPFSPQWGAAATGLPETVKRENERDKQRGRAGNAKITMMATWFGGIRRRDSRQGELNKQVET